MKSTNKQFLKKATAIAVLFCMTAQPSLAAFLQLATSPLSAGTPIAPKVMLTISKDQQLYKKAYNDYSDLDPDKMCGLVACPDGIETTYKHSIDYYGYFDPKKCYKYNNGSNRFEPERVSATKLCGASNEWSGNFLNWVSMSRMDAVRKILYGGMRSKDDPAGGNPKNAETVLERAYLPTDAHAWAKFYNPPNGVATADQPAVSQLTPFPDNPPAAAYAATTAAFTIPAADPPAPAFPNYTLTFAGSQASNFRVGDQLRMARSAAPAQFFVGAVQSMDASGQTVVMRIMSQGGVSPGAASVIETSWSVTNLSVGGVSFCNATLGAAADVSQNTNQPPLMRVAQGNFALWSANERWQCYWAEERSNLQGGFGGVRSNGNYAALSEIPASAESPSQAGNGHGTAIGNTGGVKGQYIVRVQVCKYNNGAPGTELDLMESNCWAYDAGTYKPEGLLQTYGRRGDIEFGLMTGSHAKNISGGVLRKNPGVMSDEVNFFDGTFTEPYQPPGFPTRPANALKTPDGIINTLNYMRIYGYQYSDGSYLGAGGDNCTYQLVNITENNCTSWGNPMSETFFEAIRYFASPKSGTPSAPTPTPSYLYSNTNSKDNQMGLPLATWTDPLTQDRYCTPLNVLVFNASVSTNDDDLRNTPATDINSASTMRTLTNAVGSHEGIKGDYFVGKLLGSPATAVGTREFELCSEKTIDGSGNGLGDISGICPEGPTLAGSFLIAGIAHKAHTNQIRTDLKITDASKANTALRVTTYGVQLATNVPQLTINVPGTNQNIVIQPIYRLDLGGGNLGGGALVDMKFVRQNTVAGTGKVYVNWEDSEQGGDYDQDMWGTIEWSIDTTLKTVTVTTNAISASTANPQGFGYSISGTNKDGAHFHSGIYNFQYKDVGGVLGCTDCRAVSDPNPGQKGATSFTYSYDTGSAALALQDPLWYAAKYGGFDDKNGNGLPDGINEWDSLRNSDGTISSTGDRIPDNYFLVTNPLGLEQALSRAFAKIVRDGSASALAGNSTSLQTLSTLYQATFDARDWSGKLIAHVVNQTTGAIEPTPAWEAGAELSAPTTVPDKRTIITFDDVAPVRQGIPFRWNSVKNLAMGTELNKIPYGVASDGKGSQRLDYLRGDTSLETGPAAIFRNRTSRLGDIANSSPVFVGPPSASVLDVSYRTFRDNNKDRQPMVYVGSNDGMLHGFDADPKGKGKELLAYVPSKVAQNLNKLTSPSYKHVPFVDGGIDVQDAFVNGAWKSVLVSTLGAGGRGLFALDVSNAKDFDESKAKTIALWEFTDTDDRGLGYTFGKPLIRKMANGKWAAIVSGGYNATDGDTSLTSPVTGKAFLFIIFLNGPGANLAWNEGTEYIRIPTNVGNFNTQNGLATPFAADKDGDGVVDYIYTGDLQGNFWKFDVSNATPANWKLPGNRVVLFQARTPGGAVQAITTSADGTTHPTGKGFVLTFGTGKYFESTDIGTPNVQNTIYGIWDKDDASPISGQTVVTNSVVSLPNTPRDQLLAQTITREVAPNGTVVRTLTQNPAVWSTDSTPPLANDSPTNDMGWLIDFPVAEDERVVYSPVIVSSRLVFVTNVPSASICGSGGTGYLMVVNPTTGARIDSPVIDISGDGKLSVDDRITVGGVFIQVSGKQTAVAPSGTPTIVTGGGGGAIGGPAAGGAGRIYTPDILGGITPGPLGLAPDTGRVTWREILTP